MRVLLDIPAFLWAVLEPQKLSRKVRKLLQDPKAEIVRSSVSTVEIAANYRLVAALPMLSRWCKATERL